MSHDSKNQLPIMSAFELGQWSEAGQKRLAGPRSFEKQNLEGIDLREKDMSGCDFTGAIFGIGQDLSKSILENCIFGPPREHLRSVNLVRVKLVDSVLRGAKLKNVFLVDCNLQDADLTNVDLSESDCTRTDFSNVKMFGVDLSNTNLFQAQFDKTNISLQKRPILQSNSMAWNKWCKEHNYAGSTDSDRLAQAIAIYLKLKLNFRSIGAYSEASWAYVQERRMRRSQHNLLIAPQCFEYEYPSQGVARVAFYVWHSLAWVVDAFIDLTTGYGESLLRTAITLFLFLAVVFPALYATTGGVTLTATGTGTMMSTEYIHLLLFSMGNLFQGYSGIGAATEIGKQIQISQQFFGVMMIGLLGFVLGKKINQS